mgnify:FL=1
MICEKCSLSLLFRSFYDRDLSEKYVVSGHGIGFVPLFVLSVIAAVIYAVYSLILINAFSPEIITQRITDLPDIQIENGQIVQPENFFGRYQIGDGLHLTIDTASGDETVKDPSPNEIYVSKNGIQFVKGQKVELMPLNKLFGTDNLSITKDSISDFVVQSAGKMMFVLPAFVLSLAIPLLFLKYVILTYILALVSYAATFFYKNGVPFEVRMRLGAVSAIPVFVFNLIFGILLGLFELGAIAGTIVSLIYMLYYVSWMPKAAQN